MSPAVRRATGLVLLAVVLAVTCTFLGRWQWNRHVVRDAQILLVQTNYSADPVPLDELLPTTTTPMPTADVWRPVRVSGRYDVAGTVLLRNRPVDSEPGFHVLVPLVLDGALGGPTGAVLVVDRGWVTWGDDAAGPADVPAPPSGTVTATVRLRQDEQATDRSAPPGQVQAISVPQVLAAGGGSLVGATPDAFDAYGALVEEDPAPAQVLGALPTPSTDPGSHLSYAFQWWTFALGSLVGFGMLARREVVEGREGDRPAPAPGPGADPGSPPRRRSRSRPSDEETEDALIDSQTRPTR